MYFLTSFMVLLRQLRRLYTSGSIFQVPPVYNYSTCCTNRVPTRFDTLSTRLRVRFAYASGILLKYQLRGEVRQYIDYVAHLNRIDSYHRLNKHTILYVFRAPRYDSPILLSWYKQKEITLNNRVAIPPISPLDNSFFSNPSLLILPNVLYKRVGYISESAI